LPRKLAASQRQVNSKAGSRDIGLTTVTVAGAAPPGRRIEPSRDVIAVPGLKFLRKMLKLN
jgi:hypothetical protein